MSRKIVLVVSLFALVLAACTSAAATQPAEVTAAREWLAERLGVEVERVTVRSSEEVEFSDGCLGLGGPAESCLAAITPGWLIIFEVDGDSYEVHTDVDASQIRLKE